MRNIKLTTEFSAAEAEKAGKNPATSALHLVETVDGGYYTVDSDGYYWRCYDFLKNSANLDTLTVTLETYEKAGRALGDFERSLMSFDAWKLCEVIPDFHNTPKRFENFKKSVADNLSGRADQCAPEIQFALDFEPYLGLIAKGLKDGKIPLRVTHNDTKLSNIMVDKDTQEVLCFIDLDTIMPGSALYDFGDALRSAGSSAAEDEADLSKVHFLPENFESFCRGYLTAARNFITPAEINLLPESVAILTYECGIRFLGDFIDGDTYFATAYPEHNLVRARNQFKLVADIMGMLPRLHEIVENLLKPWNKILNFGSLNVDYVYNVDHFVTPGETVTSLSRQVNCGGKGLNQSIACAQSGAKVFHAGRIGADGTMLTELLASKGVDISLVKTDEGSSGHAIIEVDKNGQNSIILFPGANSRITSEQIDEALAGFGDCDFLILQNEINCLPELIKKAFEKGMLIFLNPSPITDSLFDCPLDLVHYFVLNEIECSALGGAEDPIEALGNLEKKFPKAGFLLTLGTKGAIFSHTDLTEGAIVSQPGCSLRRRISYGIHKAPVVDTTAAGDTILGFFVGLLSRGFMPAKALELATKAAAITVSGKGAAPSIPSFEQTFNCPYPYVPFEDN